MLHLSEGIVNWLMFRTIYRLVALQAICTIVAKAQRPSFGQNSPSLSEPSARPLIPYPYPKKIRHFGRIVLLERVKGFEPSTSTLARLRSTPELRPHRCDGCIYAIKKNKLQVFFLKKIKYFITI